MSIARAMKKRGNARSNEVTFTLAVRTSEEISVVHTVRQAVEITERRKNTQQKQREMRDIK